MSDARGLVGVALPDGTTLTLCGTHDLMHRRAGAPATSVAELRALLNDRRDSDRRAYRGEVDELAASLAAAFVRDRRGQDRRSN